MPDAGRIFCVAFPFVATLAALVVLLAATLGGKHIHSVYMFQVNLTDLSIDPAGVSGILDNIKDSVNASDIQDTLENLPTDAKERFKTIQDQIESLTGSSAASSSSSRRDIVDDILQGSDNITAADLGLQNIYQVNLWGTCSGANASETTCTSPKWDWASSMLNTTWLENVGSAMGANITLPDEIETGIKTFNTSIKWLQIVFVAALALLGLELFFGLFSSCSRVWSCLAYVVAGVATTLAAAAAIFATVVCATVVAVIKASAELYGADADFNTTFLAMIWISVALAITASLFWCITACCCANKRKPTATPYGEKHYSSGSYAPLSGGAASPAYAQQGAANRDSTYQSSGAYEPYSHRV
jgi:hypothetical protein